MAKIFVAEREHNADANVFKVDHDYKADLLFCEVDREHEAKGDALWFFVDREHQAGFKIYWVEREHQADIKVFKVDREHKAGWKKKNRFKTRIGE